MKVTLLLHLHQPLYWIPRTGRPPLALLPWTFLHGIGEYYDLARLLQETPAGRLTLNLTPVLLDQWEAYARKAVEDVFLHHARRPADRLSPTERSFLLSHFFAAHPVTQIGRFPRYRELQEKARESDLWTPQDFRDLQVLFVLAYAGEFARRDHPALQALSRKGHRFSEEDKTTLFQAAHEILQRVPVLYRHLASTGRVEVSLSPYFHPILPLLVDAREHRRAGGHGPAVEGVAWPEDARWHLEAAHLRGQRALGRRNFGLWPSEGSVSEAAVRLIQQAGYRWAASDQGVLAKSQPGALPDRVYHCCRLPLVFRDTDLSDRIGFTYGTWPPEEAAADLVRRLHERRSNGSRLTALILDGENPWPHYLHGGMAFLRHLLEAVDRAPGLEWATVEEVVSQLPHEPLDHLAPGSWIHGTFDTWMGHPEKRRAWEVLREARQHLIQHLTPHLDLPFHDPDPHSQAAYAFFAAEGSDWFWWLGDDHPTPLAPVFDRLFRGLLQAAFELLGLPVPSFLSTPIKGTPPPIVEQPRALIRPQLDGRVSHYLEWHNAGRLRIAHQPAMAGEPLQAVYYGFDENFLYLRLDFHRPCREVFQEGRVRVQFKTPEGMITLEPEHLESHRWACDEVLELALSWPEPRPVRLALALEVHLRKGRFRYPATGWVELDLATDWMV